MVAPLGSLVLRPYQLHVIAAMSARYASPQINWMVGEEVNTGLNPRRLPETIEPSRSQTPATVGALR